jgi:RimJ/RimL family protein N-acetyltransferase
MRKDASCVLAEVIGNNIASIKAFTKAGYKFKNIKIKSGRQVRVFIYKK